MGGLCVGGGTVCVGGGELCVCVGGWGGKVDRMIEQFGDSGSVCGGEGEMLEKCGGLRKW